ncbi:Glycosyltransferase involved in cell wall bisynthesis [Flavobacterium flevense]|uniref:Glycosyl transferase family 1 n=2 Tax=Flavobacterium flevense TaxID=983 RepID=A0A4Y4AZL9_9FLAO|nr:glycosyl transferase family 1 [Flavobacterium flevense]SHM08201.1 Glycosyltransferase involved in cell wall bisynthesis [Flavobacterium flevense]
MSPLSGGTSQAIRNIIPNLESLNVKNDVVCLDAKDQDYGLKDNFNVYKIGKGKTSYQYSPLLTDWFLKKLQYYDVVVVHGIWQYANYGIYKAIKKVKKSKSKLPKVIIMPHGMLDPYFQKAADRKWKALRNEIVWRLTEKKAINAADAVFFTCEEELNLARTTFRGYKPKLAINVGIGIPNPPAETTEMRSAFKLLSPSVPNNYWLFLSRIHPKKGIDLLITAYNNLCLKTRNIPDLVIAGPTHSLYAEEMIALAKDNSKIHFVGMLSGKAKWGAFYGCQAYLLPSHQENFGIAIVEAMACEKPVLITKNINIWREIQADNSGWILEDLTVASIEQQLQEIAALPVAKIKQTGRQAKQTFEDKFNVRNQSKIFVATLNNVIKPEC